MGWAFYHKTVYVRDNLFKEAVKKETDNACFKTTTWGLAYAIRAASAWPSNNWIGGV